MADEIETTIAPSVVIPSTSTTTTTIGPIPTLQAPTNPIMGAYLESYAGKGDWTATAGGKPNYAWTTKDPPTSYHPLQQRPLQQNFKLKAHH